MTVTFEEVEKLESMMATLVEWSGVSDDTPDDTEILEYNGSAITLGDVRDASVFLAKCRELAVE